MKGAALLLAAAGFSLTLYAGIHIFMLEEKQHESLKEARRLLAEAPNEYESLPADPPLPRQGNILGLLEIPVLGLVLPIIEGTAPENLEKGVGHFEGTGLPAQGRQIVLSGHRDSVFRNLGKIQDGDDIIIRLPQGSFHYKAAGFEVVKGDDMEVIDAGFRDEKLTMTTCYPFSYIGDAPDRYVITAFPN